MTLWLQILDQQEQFDLQDCSTASKRDISWAHKYSEWKSQATEAWLSENGVG